MTDYSLEETKNMTRALRHADYPTFRQMLKSEERFSPWLESLENKDWARIHFEWLDAHWIHAPLNDVESIVISAIGDGLIENENWPLAYNCLMRLPASTKAQRKRTQVLENYIQTSPVSSIETAYMHAAQAFYDTASGLPDDLRQHGQAYYALALNRFNEPSLRDALHAVSFHADIVSPLDAIRHLLDSLETRAWSEVLRAARFLACDQEASGVYAWLVWFAECVLSGADEKTAALILVWSVRFWPVVRDPLQLRAKVLALFPDATDMLLATDDPSQFGMLEDAVREPFLESRVLCAMLTDDSKTVTRQTEHREKLAQNCVVSAIIAAWLDIMDAPDRLAQTIRASLRTQPTILCLYATLFSHACVAANEREDFANKLFALGEDAVLLLSRFPHVVTHAFDETHQHYIRLLATTADAAPQQTAPKPTSSDDASLVATPQTTALAKHRPFRVVAALILLMITLFILFKLFLATP